MATVEGGCKLRVSAFLFVMPLETLRSNKKYIYFTNGSRKEAAGGK